MMRRLFSAVAAGALACALATPASAFQSMRVQRAITLTFNVQLVYEPFGFPSAFGFPSTGLGMGVGLAPAGPRVAAPVMIAATQGAAKVNANVIADPNAGLLVLNKTAFTGAITTSGTAPVTTTYPCAFTFQVGVGSTITWSVQDGVASDFGSLPASDVAWQTYPTPGAAPSPASYTNYINYYTNNSVWQTASHGTGPTTHCVDLEVNAPAGLPTGQYSATAVYSLYY